MQSPVLMLLSWWKSKWLLQNTPWSFYSLNIIETYCWTLWCLVHHCKCLSCMWKVIIKKMAKTVNSTTVHALKHKRYPKIFLSMNSMYDIIQVFNSCIINSCIRTSCMFFFLFFLLKQLTARKCLVKYLKILKLLIAQD